MGQAGGRNSGLGQVVVGAQSPRTSTTRFPGQPPAQDRCYYRCLPLLVSSRPLPPAVSHTTDATLARMPIITIELVGEQQRDREPPLAQSLANAIAKALGSAPAQAWVRVRWLPPNDYAENDAAASSENFPVFVGIVKRSVPVGPELEAEVSELTQVIAHEVGRPPESIHIEYAASAAGRISFGGRLVE